MPEPTPNARDNADAPEFAESEHSPGVATAFDDPAAKHVPEAPRNSPAWPASRGGSDASHRPPAPPVPRYLQSLIDAGALDEPELAQVRHRSANVTLSGQDGREVTRALAHLAPDAVATIRRLVGAGHVTGTIHDGADPIHFALLIDGPAEDVAPVDSAAAMAQALEAAVARIERRLSEKTPVQRLGEQFVIEAVTRALEPPAPVDPMQMLDGTVKQLVKLVQSANGMRDKLAPLAAMFAPAVAAQVDEAQAAGVLPKLIERATEWIMQPGNIMRLISMAKGQFADAETVVDATPEPVAAE